jgi:Tol biopolymer transport system component
MPLPLSLKGLYALRDPVVAPDGRSVVVVAYHGSKPTLLERPIVRTGEWTPIFTIPPFDSAQSKSSRNRADWFVGTPRFFPDGKHLVFEGTNPLATNHDVGLLTILDRATGNFAIVEVDDAHVARTPDVHPDGETIIFAACEELRVGRVSGFGDQHIQTRAVVRLSHAEGAHSRVCTVHRPRFSRDGKRVVFEVIGRHLAVEERERYGVPSPINDGDALIEPWIMNTDGSAVRRLIDNDAYAALGGRLQDGPGTAPDFSPDGQWVVFAHGSRIAMVSVEGKRASHLRAPGAHAEGNAGLIKGAAPGFTPDGRRVVLARKVSGRTPQNLPEITVVDW